MDFDKTIDLIIKDLEEARDIIDDLKRYPEVPELQVELAKSKCKSAGEIISLLKKMELNIRTENGDSVSSVDGQEEKKEVSLPDVSPDNEEKREVSEVAEKIPPDNKEESGTGIVPEEKEMTGKEEKDEESPKKKRSSILADKYSHPSDRINEQLGNRKRGEDLSDMIKVTPITSLVKAIGVNDKFLFIREIFNGNTDEYNKVISRVDSAKDYEEAMNILTRHTDKSNDKDVSRQLLKLVNRKFRINE